MKFYLMPMIIGLLVIVGPDVWIYWKIRKRIGNTYLRYVYWLPALFFVLFFCGMRLFSHDVPDYRLMSHITWILWLFALIYLPKLFYALFDIIGWILNGFSRKNIALAFTDRCRVCGRFGDFVAIRGSCRAHEGICQAGGDCL